MKIRKIYALTAAAMMALVFSACSNDELKALIPPSGSSNTAFAVNFNGSSSAARTRAEKTGAEGTQPSETREALLKNVYAVAFLNGKYYGTFKGTKTFTTEEVEKIQGWTNDPTWAPADNEYKFDFRKIGSYKAYFIANVDGTYDDVTTFKGTDGFIKDLTDGLNENSVPADLFSIVMAQNPGVGGDADDFMMVSKEQTVNIDATQIKDQGEIEVERLSARIDVIINNAAAYGTDILDVDGDTENDFKVTAIEFKNRYMESVIARDEINGKLMTIGGNDLAKKDTTYTMETGGVNKCEATLYGYENYNSFNTETSDPETDGVTIIHLTGVYSRGENAKMDVDYNIPFVGSDKKPIVIERNHLYKLTVKRANNTPDQFVALDYEIKVIDWSTGETLKVVNGSLKDEKAPSLEEVNDGTSAVTNSSTDSDGDPIYEIADDVTTVTIKTKTYSVGQVRLVTDNYRQDLYNEDGILIGGIEIAHDETQRVHSDADGSLTQMFIVTFPANTGTADISYKLWIENPFYASGSASRIGFTLIHKAPAVTP